MQERVEATNKNCDPRQDATEYRHDERAECRFCLSERAKVRLCVALEYEAQEHDDHQKLSKVREDLTPTHMSGPGIRVTVDESRTKQEVLVPEETRKSNQ